MRTDSLAHYVVRLDSDALGIMDNTVAFSFYLRVWHIGLIRP